MGCTGIADIPFVPRHYVRWRGVLMTKRKREPCGHDVPVWVQLVIVFILATLFWAAWTLPSIASYMHQSGRAMQAELMYHVCVEDRIAPDKCLEWSIGE